jgi:hypothetical protein
MNAQGVNSTMNEERRTRAKVVSELLEKCASMITKIIEDEETALSQMANGPKQGFEGDDSRNAINNLEDAEQNISSAAATLY